MEGEKYDIGSNFDKTYLVNPKIGYRMTSTINDCSGKEGGMC